MEKGDTEDWRKVLKDATGEESLHARHGGILRAADEVAGRSRTKGRPIGWEVYFYYSAMNAGKSTVLLQSSYNYHERGMRTLLFIPAIDTRAGAGRIQSRIGLDADAIALSPGENLLEQVRAAHAAQPVACVLVDEAQFLTRAQVEQLTDVADLCAFPCCATGCARISRRSFFPAAPRCSRWPTT